jgi:hypothetical protein
MKSITTQLEIRTAETAEEIKNFLPQSEKLTAENTSNLGVFFRLLSNEINNNTVRNTDCGNCGTDVWEHLDSAPAVCYCASALAATRKTAGSRAVAPESSNFEKKIAGIINFKTTLQSSNENILPFAY